MWKSFLSFQARSHCKYTSVWCYFSLFHRFSFVVLNLYCSKKGLHELGLHHLHRATELDPSNPEALVSMARSLIEIGNFSQAGVYLQTCLYVAPEYQQAYAYYGLLMDKLGESFSLIFKWNAKSSLVLISFFTENKDSLCHIAPTRNRLVWLNKVKDGSRKVSNSSIWEVYGG